MDNLPMQSIVFIYQDGGVETVPITHFPHHLDSLQNNLEKMPRFANLCYKYKFAFHEYVNYMPIVSTLAKEGTVSLINFNLRDIVNDPSLLNYDLPGIEVYLPHDFGSLRQLEHIEKLLLYYPENRLCFNHYQGIEFKEKTTLEIAEFVRTWKNNFDEKHTL